MLIDLSDQLFWPTQDPRQSEMKPSYLVCQSLCFSLCHLDRSQLGVQALLHGRPSRRLCQQCAFGRHSVDCMPLEAQAFQRPSSTFCEPLKCRSLLSAYGPQHILAERLLRHHCLAPHRCHQGLVHVYEQHLPAPFRLFPSVCTICGSQPSLGILDRGRWRHPQVFSVSTMSDWLRHGTNSLRSLL